MKRKSTGLLATVSAALLVLTSIQPASAARWSPPAEQMQSLGVNISESTLEATGGTSQLLVMERLPQGTSGMPEQKLCNDLGPSCEPSKEETPFATLILPPCESIAALNCIEALVFTDIGTNQTRTATLIRSVAGPTVEAKPAWGIPYGGTTSLWQAEGFNHEGGTDTYAVTAQVGLGTNGKIYNLTNLNAVVNPFTEISGNYKEVQFNEFQSNLGTTAFGTTGWNPGCAWTEAGKCGQFEDFSEGVKLDLKLRVSTQISGWFKGRLSSANVTTKELSKTQRQLVFSGQPVEVPMFAFSKPLSAATESELNFMKKAVGWTGGRLGSRSDSEGAFNGLAVFRESAYDTATGVVTTWSVGALSPGGNLCFQDKTKVHGLVTTNSMVYQPSAPTFSSGSLNYKVAGTHYLAGGKELAKGSYELLVRLETARCLYGFSNAPISASVSVTGSDEVATTVVKESKGWLKLSAQGFTFSAKTIKVKLTQKKTTITCVAPGKKAKKVTAANPKCPKGYKKR